MRLIPQVRALRVAASRPAVRQVTIGLFLLGPAGLWIAGDPRPMPDDAVSIGALAEGTAIPAGEAVTRLWAAQQLRDQREEAITQLASEFEVAEPLAADIHDAAVSEAIDPRVAFGLVKAESSFRARAVSPVGAVGLTQVMPATARLIVPGTRGTDLLNPDINLRVGFKYLRRLLEQYEGNERLALTAYNRGPGTVDRLLNDGRNPDNGYAEKVLTRKGSRHGALMNASLGRSLVSSKKAAKRS